MQLIVAVTKIDGRSRYCSYCASKEMKVIEAVVLAVGLMVGGGDGRPSGGNGGTSGGDGGSSAVVVAV